MGKGRCSRVVPRDVRVRGRHKRADDPAMWLGRDGIGQSMLHDAFAHSWLAEGGDRAMVRRRGADADHRRVALGDRL